MFTCNEVASVIKLLFTSLISIYLDMFTFISISYSNDGVSVVSPAIQNGTQYFQTGEVASQKWTATDESHSEGLSEII